MKYLIHSVITFQTVFIIVRTVIIFIAMLITMRISSMISYKLSSPIMNNSYLIKEHYLRNRYKHYCQIEYIRFTQAKSNSPEKARIRNRSLQFYIGE